MEQKNIVLGRDEKENEIQELQSSSRNDQRVDNFKEDPQEKRQKLEHQIEDVNPEQGKVQIIPSGDSFPNLNDKLIELDIRG